MPNRTCLAVLTALFVAASSSAGAQPHAMAAGLTTTEMAADAADRAHLTEAIVTRWRPFVEEAYHADGEQWAGELARLASYSSLDVLRRAARARDFDVMNQALLRTDVKPPAAADLDAIAAGRIGDVAQDLVYVPVTPCRIIDTRLAGGPIGANGTRAFDVTSVTSYTSQGGDASNCGVGAAGEFAAAVINFTVVTPAAAGYVTAYPVGVPRPTTATVNYAAGDVRGNLAVVKLDQGASVEELVVYSFATTHLVADVVGYFTNPIPDTLQCVTTGPLSVDVGPGAGVGMAAPACAAGYIETATYCESTSLQVSVSAAAAGVCAFRNNGASVATVRASRRCCRSAAP